MSWDIAMQTVQSSERCMQLRTKIENRQLAIRNAQQKMIEMLEKLSTRSQEKIARINSNTV